MPISSFRLMIISGCVFLVLNIIENLIHFSIGRSTQQKNVLKFSFVMPTKQDLVKIIFIMLLFAMLQAFFTCYFQEYFHQ